MSKKKWLLSEIYSHSGEHLFAFASLTVLLTTGHPAFAESTPSEHTVAACQPVAASVRCLNSSFAPTEPSIANHIASMNVAYPSVTIDLSHAVEDTPDGVYNNVCGDDVEPVTVINMTATDALDAVVAKMRGETQPSLSVLQDLLYALRQISNEQEAHDTTYDITSYVSLLHRYVIFEWVDFNQLAGHLEWGTLIVALDKLQSNLVTQNKNDIVKSLNQIVYGTLYESLYTGGESLFRHHPVDEFGFASNRNILSFLYDLSGVASEKIERGGHHVEMNTHAYVMERVWYHLAKSLGRCERPGQGIIYEQAANYEEEENRQFYARYRSLEALYLLFLGQNEEAAGILNELAQTESAFHSYLISDRSLESLVNVIVTGNIAMLGESNERSKSALLERIFFMAKFPVRPYSPSTILDRMNLDAFRAVRAAFVSVLNDQPDLLEPRFVSEINNEAIFEQLFIDKLKLEQKRVHWGEKRNLNESASANLNESGSAGKRKSKKKNLIEKFWVALKGSSKK